MSEDWNAIAAEVDAAIKSVADIGMPGGYPAALRTAANGVPANRWEPRSGNPSYVTVYCLEGVREIRSNDGTTVLQTLRTIMISATGAVPVKDQKIAIGITAEQAATGQHQWHSIDEVRPLSPAGVAVLYEVDLVA